MPPDRITGLLLGTAVGDALGLPRENLSRRRGRRLFGGPPVQHGLMFGCGMTSDDTEHACLTAQALLASADAGEFARALGRRLRWWLLTLPTGLGRATLLSCLRLWCGYSARSSGVWSAGNGPAMRSAVLGACLGPNPARLAEFVRVSSRATHTDPRAERGAMLVALAADAAIRSPRGVPDAPALLDSLSRFALSGEDLVLGNLVADIGRALSRRDSAEAFADRLGLSHGVSGYIYHTVPVALYCWLRHAGNFRDGVEAAIDLGGDTDSSAAIVGALAGGSLGVEAIPEEWLAGLLEWPRTVGWMRAVADRLAARFGDAGGPDLGPVPLLWWPGLWPRNLVFLVAVLAHLVRRGLPPY